MWGLWLQKRIKMSYILTKKKWEGKGETRTFRASGGQDVLVGKWNTKLINQIKELYIYLKLQR